MINLPEKFKVVEKNADRQSELQTIHEALEKIRLFMEREISYKQGFIDRQDEQIRQLKTIDEEKETTIQRIEGQLLECRQTNEGTRQLINKLLSDISSYQKDIEWYKRTYEKRSLAGMIRQKLFRR